MPMLLNSNFSGLWDWIRGSENVQMSMPVSCTLLSQQCPVVRVVSCCGGLRPVCWKIPLIVCRPFGVLHVRILHVHHLELCTWGTPESTIEA